MSRSKPSSRKRRRLKLKRQALEEARGGLAELDLTPIAWPRWRHIIRRDPCTYCGRIVRRATHDHVVPRVLGGQRHAGNIVAACQPCNARKGARSVLEHLLLELERGV